MFRTISRKNMSQKLSFLLLVFGLIWGLMLLHYTLQQPRRQSSVKLREQILDLSKRYVKALAEESRSTADVDSGASMAGYVLHLPGPASLYLLSNSASQEMTHC
ncbi:coiled-coil domain-containing protein 126 isoform 2 precursor [Mus musculus]|uniref:Isoform 2 of Coiled-coil domain-containing protein 126 n=1 Tax=Mus musculus TaxID=10090 RepID=Q8BIS8-2|nr:coiled-coil domain-containing protein 126 isoform 2 precursor [Mus musculus]AAH95987.1 Ccdc126 protein [Mus musculus]EDK98607.1 RIKEN cDNA 6330407D12, isoform CRA_b [Mus musculus]|eukprot:NP_001298041.1 coiled-coil domain-containing protein 126 isoform 2 precursor [Mus musculus]